MKPLEWNDKLIVDNGLIDEDHHILLDIINEFRQQVGHFNSSDDAIKILESLKLYTEQHFFREEELQRVVKFPYREAHHNEHKTLINKLDSMMMETKDASGEYLNSIVADKIGILLKDWLFDHVLDNDLRMKPYIEEMRSLAKKMGVMGR